MHLLIFPVDSSKARSKTSPSNVFREPLSQDYSSQSQCAPKVAALAVLEQQMDQETISMFEERLEEGYDLIDDPLYNAWSKLKKTVCTSGLSKPTPTEE